ncbi:hypothetical protein LSAT2_006599 [Lamellibrachia satsuma]|nr:hypothetical protein LSAT2_006599 [Lamellibrachia satsuma]
MLSRVVETSWIKQNDEEPTIAIWQFLSTSNGLMRWYPGISGHGGVFTPSKQEWYLHAVAQPSRFIISPPHIDVFGKSTVVITLSRALTTFENGTETVFGVLAVAVPFEHMYSHMLSIYPCDKSQYK